MNFITIFISIFLIYSNAASPSDTCSRSAVVNYQEILMDTDSTKKGEGLRYFLEKDPISKVYLDRYQEGAQNRWINAAFGTLGTLLIFAGIISDGNNRNSLLIGGSSLITVNFLVAKTIEYKNEENLIKAIDEYNQRNLPRIYYGEDSKNRFPSGDNGIYINFTKNF